MRSGNPWRAGQTRLDPRRNGLNLLRLILATVVLVSHAWNLSGRAPAPMLNGDELGTWAVYGFFAISGYLITGSRLGNSVGTYLVHRVARIFPAFLVCLVVTAFVFAPIAYVHQHHTIDGFLTTPVPPLDYVVANAGLRIGTYTVAGTLTDVPYQGAWDGSLWTLFYEFVCYLIVGALCCFAAVRRQVRWLVGAFVVTTLTWIAINWLAPYTGGNSDVFYLAKLLPYFLAGGILYMIRDRIPLTWPLMVISVAVSAALVLEVPRYGNQLAAPFVSYAVMWLGAVLPCPDLVRRHDVSYGIYVYAFPVQQLLAVAGLAVALPLPLYDLLALVVTAPLAIASWLLVERPVMRRARAATKRLPRAPSLPEDLQNQLSAPIGQGPPVGTKGVTG